jgi:dienelactone hydrolase
MNIPDDIRVLVFSKSAIPNRTGPHAVGTATLRVWAPAEGGKARAITTQLWYPADSAGKSSGRPFGSGWLSRLRHPTWAPAHHGAPLMLAKAKLPLITYVPDAGGHHDDNTYTLANLASHGFVLAAIDDPFRDGAATVGTGAGASENGAFTALYEHRVGNGVKAASALLDALQGLRSEGPGGAWAGRLNLRQVGILGYAMGGAVAAETTLVDDRYVAAARLDGAICGEAHVVRVPYLLMLSDVSMPTTDETRAETSGEALESPLKLGEFRRAQCQAALPESHVFEIIGTKREHFSDRLIYPSRRIFGRRRLATYKRVRAIIDSYTVAFFSTYLQGAPHPLMCVRHSPYAEVRFVTTTDEQTGWLHREPAGRS